MDSGCHTLHNSLRFNDGRCARVSEEECRLSQDLAQSGVSQIVTKGSMLSGKSSGPCPAYLFECATACVGNCEYDLPLCYLGLTVVAGVPTRNDKIPGRIRCSAPIF